MKSNFLYILLKLINICAKVYLDLTCLKVIYKTAAKKYGHFVA